MELREPILSAPKTQRPRKCAASVVNDDRTLAISATLRSARARTGPTSAATTSAARPPLPARSVTALAARNRCDYRSIIGSIEIRLIRRLILIEVIPILIAVLRDLLRTRCSSTCIRPSAVRADLTRLRQAKLRALFP